MRKNWTGSHGPPVIKKSAEEIQQMVPEHRILLFGSSSLLATIPSAAPESLGVKLTLDADFFIDPDDLGLRRKLLHQFGEDRPYHALTGYYGDFVDLRMTESFPAGWRERLIPVPEFQNVWAFDPTDVATSKVGATASTPLNRRLGSSLIDRGRKDVHTVSALIRTGHIELAELEKRLGSMDWEPSLVVEADQVVREILALLAKSAAGQDR